MSVERRFVWFDLLTPDPRGAKAFYSALTGWTTQPFQGSDYEIWHDGDTMIGGVGTPPPNTPPHWMGAVAVEDADASAQKAQRLGGKVLSPPMDIPNSGRYAVLADPQGATFSVYAANGPRPAPDREKPGRFSWAELNSTDWKSAWKFYAELFGWQKTSSMDMGPGLGEYFMFGTGSEQSMGGMSDAAKSMKLPAHWLYYFNVQSVDETCKRIPQLGGKVVNGPMDVPGNDRIAQGLDPQGVMFAIYSRGPAS